MYEKQKDGTTRETGTAYLKFLIFESLAAAGNFAGFLASFRVTGVQDPITQFQARMRFMAFTAQFVQREYDPVAWPVIHSPACSRMMGSNPPSNGEEPTPGLHECRNLYRNVSDHGAGSIV